MTNTRTVFQYFSGLIYKLSRKLFSSFPYGVAIYRWPAENSSWAMVVPKLYLKIIILACAKIVQGLF